VGTPLIYANNLLQLYIRMNFQVPQFIEQKAKIVGPFTLQQFLYIAVAGLLSFSAFKIFDFFIWLLITLFVGTVAIFFAFVKINGQDMIKIFSAGMKFFWSPKVYAWKKIDETNDIEVGESQKIDFLRKAMGLQEKLKNIATGITTGKIIKNTSTTPPTKKSRERGEAVLILETGERKIAKRIDY